MQFPPVPTPFNPSKTVQCQGRPKTVETPYTALQKVLGRKVSLAGSGRKIPIQKALLLRLRELAHTGDRRAVALQQRILAMARPKPVEAPFVDLMDAKDRFMEIALANPEWAEELRDDGEE